MLKSLIQARQKAASTALGSVRAEGLEPSNATKKRVDNFVHGRITAKEMHAATLREVKRSIKATRG